MIGIAAAIPLLILIARIVETSLETIRTIYVARGGMPIWLPVSAS